MLIFFNNESVNKIFSELDLIWILTQNLQCFLSFRDRHD